MNDALNVLKARFSKRILADADEIVQAMREGDYATLERVIHGLAGAAGLFGYSALSASALAIDAEFGSGNKPSNESFIRLVDLIRAESALYS
ncbi:Hpt domain-containing protein [Brevundimonas vesicularis]|uniref:Hpt domain-containing protein n=1 Tax=Brevundimonas vesicularis TaxID=41276 RepID=UPI0038D37240